ncbi:hypothetical protein NCU04950 [Neurospora crassa OR74A]|uniref:Uncharacterized protein n=1 Tax=Neurospora crassa (strain ATCC 24698 / 74-OR23-1A / CBS 708.71 / DSM 1257 / FGSC 987) TaxID=367110 RepID=V5INP6_NEUCR|nr:hypothetical protein NCU04950 [Neurospora crassa OR74A]ESA42784.1 hypothetical protein NCU04950 [Neurospora crassa OR74A]|eukprot:XP_011394122.1 hypothetical protein NCU04950 [Neurospora crassa OR74A]
MCTQAITQSLCSHCKELLLEVTTEERCPKVIQAQAYTFSCGAKKTTKAREYPRKCVACIKKEREEEEEEGSDKNGRSRMGERSGKSSPVRIETEHLSCVVCCSYEHCMCTWLTSTST